MSLKCLIFDTDVTSLTPEQLKERCSGCLEHRGGKEHCTHLLNETENENDMSYQYRVAIPSYKRSHLIQGKVLKMLADQNIYSTNIDIFVSSQEEYNAYADRGLKVIYEKPLNSLTEKFNFIHQYYMPGTKVVVLEDDITDIKKLAGYNMLESINNLGEEIIHGFLECEKNSTKLWGINSNNNPFFMGNSPSVGLKFICANVYGFIADEEPVICEAETKTDYERTILYYKKYGNVVRLDYLCPITKNYKTEGGIGVEGRWDAEERSVEFLTTKYPEYCKRNVAKKSTYPEMLLRLDMTQARDTAEHHQLNINDFLGI